MKTFFYIAFICSVCMLLGYTVGNNLLIADRLNINSDIISLTAPENWRWIRTNLPIDIFFRMIDTSKAVQEANGEKFPGALNKITYPSEIVSVDHEFLFDNKGDLRFVNWYYNVNKLTVSKEIPVPQANLLSRNHYRGKYIPIKWECAFEGVFEVEIEVLCENERWERRGHYFAKNKNLIHENTGENQGRWRLRCITMTSIGNWSEYAYFSCKE